MLLEEPAIRLLDDHVQSLEVCAVLVPTTVLVGLFDNAEMHVVRLWRCVVREVMEFETRPLEEPLLATLQEITLLDQGREIELLPQGVVRPTVVVMRLKIMGA